MSSILQGTTPLLTLQVDDITMSDVSVLELVMKNNNLMMVKGLEDVSIDDHAFSYLFTQEETLALDPNYVLIIQARFKIGQSVLGTEEERIDVMDLISTEVI